MRQLQKTTPIGALPDLPIRTLKSVASEKSLLLATGVVRCRLTVDQTQLSRRASIQLRYFEVFLSRKTKRDTSTF